MTETRLPFPETTLPEDVLPPSAAYREIARQADPELREWLRRRAERRSRLRGRDEEVSHRSESPT